MLRPDRLLGFLAAICICLKPGLACADGAVAQHSALLTGSVAIEAGKYLYYKVPVDLATMADPRIGGHVVASGGSGNDVEVLVLRESDFLNWQNDHTTHPLFSSGRVTATDLDVPLTSTGTYYVVISNAFSDTSPKTVEGSVDVTWTPPPPTKEEEAATGAELAIVVGVLIAAAGFGGFVVWFVMSRRKKASESRSSGLPS
jgi:hypothetical protein